MSGHSKWATIRRKKEKVDAARGKTFSRLIKEITVAARIAGSDEDGNPRLRTAIAAAKAENMPAANIDRAIKKGTGELPGVNYEEVTYEAYGPGGTAMLIEVLTDNKNRVIADIRHIVTKNGGSMGDAGSVGWMFQRVGVIEVASGGVSEDALIEAALESGADDVKSDDGTFNVYTPSEKLDDVRVALEKEGFKIESAAHEKIPQTYVPVEGRQANQIMRLMEALDEHDDVQQVWSNFSISDEVLEDA